MPRLRSRRSDVPLRLNFGSPETKDTLRCLLSLPWLCELLLFITSSIVTSLEAVEQAVVSSGGSKTGNGTVYSRVAVKSRSVDALCVALSCAI
jgi:hypothetical protein